MHFFKIATVFAITASLAACVTPSDDVASPPPSIETIVQLGKAEYAAKFGRTPKDYRVTSVRHVNVFAHRLDHLVCVTTTETHTHDGYNNAGELTSPAGSKYTGRFAHIIRDYKGSPGQWSPTLFRSVRHGVEMGNINSLTDYCTRSKS